MFFFSCCANLSADLSRCTSQAQFIVGTHYELGLQVDKDIEHAKEYLLASAVQDFAPAQAAIGIRLVDEGAFDDGIHWLERAVQSVRNVLFNCYCSLLKIVQIYLHGHRIILAHWLNLLPCTKMDTASSKIMNLQRSTTRPQRTAATVCAVSLSAQIPLWRSWPGTESPRSGSIPVASRIRRVSSSSAIVGTDIPRGFCSTSRLRQATQRSAE